MSAYLFKNARHSKNKSLRPLVDVGGVSFLEGKINRERKVIRITELDNRISICRRLNVRFLEQAHAVPALFELGLSTGLLT